MGQFGKLHKHLSERPLIPYVNKSVAIAKKADRTVYDVSYRCRTEPQICRYGWTCTVPLRWRQLCLHRMPAPACRGVHMPASVFRCVSWLYDTSYSKSKSVWRS